jgi:hypothetical protein
MQVKTGARVVHGYYVHMMLHDSLSTWCDYQLLPEESRPRIPSPAGTTTTVIYTTQTVINPGTPPEAITAAQAGTQARITSILNAVRGSRSI